MEKVLVDPNKLCMGCMATIGTTNQPCPHCGFHMSTYKRPRNSMPPMEILNGKYLVGRVIGIGGFGITYIGWDFYQGKKVCIKEYFPRAIALREPENSSQAGGASVSIPQSLSVYTQHTQQAQQEYLQGLQSYIKEAENLSKFYLMDGIVSVRDFFYGNNTAYIVMEYIDGIDLKTYAKAKGGRMSQEELFAVLKDVLEALHEVHQENIIHRDISPDNIMLTRDYKAKLIDFGAAKDYLVNRKETVLLKHGYAPIEQYHQDGKQGPWTDVYSMCASIYYLLTGVRIPNAIERQKKDEIQLLQAMGVPVSEECDLAIKKGLSILPEQRYQSISQLYQVFYGEKLT